MIPLPCVGKFLFIKAIISFKRDVYKRQTYDGSKYHWKSDERYVTDSVLSDPAHIEWLHKMCIRDRIISA